MMQTAIGGIVAIEIQTGAVRKTLKFAWLAALCCATGNAIVGSNTALGDENGATRGSSG
jgi:hypothetical protein